MREREDGQQQLTVRKCWQNAIPSPPFFLAALGTETASHRIHLLHPERKRDRELLFLFRHKECWPHTRVRGIGDGDSLFHLRRRERSHSLSSRSGGGCSPSTHPGIPPSPLRQSPLPAAPPPSAGPMKRGAAARNAVFRLWCGKFYRRGGEKEIHPAS